MEGKEDIGAQRVKLGTCEGGTGNKSGAQAR